MALRETAGVTIGAMIPLASSVLVIFLLPFLVIGLLGEESDVVLWLFVLLLVASPVVGGAVAGFMQGTDWRVGVLLGGLTGALGSAAAGAVFGVGFSIYMLSMTPGHGPGTMTFSELAPRVVSPGAAIGFAVGAVLGIVGGAGGTTVRRRLA